MKFWVKIVIAFSIVLVAGFATWAFFFKEKDSVVAFNRVSELIEYKESTNLQGKLNELGKLSYLNGSKELQLDTTSESGANIQKLRNNLFSEGKIEVYDDDNNLVLVYNSYILIEEYVNEFITYMLPYINNIEGYGSLIRQIKGSTKDYISLLKETNESIDLVMYFQKSIKGENTTEYDILYGKYNDLYLDFRGLLNESANLMNLMIEYYKSANDSEILTTTYLSLNDAFARTLKVMTSVELINELDYSNDLYYISDKIDKHNAGQSIYNSEYTELNYLRSYNKLLNSDSGILDKVFSKKYIEKKQMADGQNLSEIPENIQLNVIQVLNVLGF